MTIERTDQPYTVMDSVDDIWGLLDWIDVALTLWRTAITPVSRNAKYGRFDLVMVQYPRGDKFKILATAREAGELMCKSGVVCGMVGFDKDFTYWLIRRSQIDWAMYLMGGEPGSELNRPKQFWRDSKGRVRRADRPKAGRATMRRDGESWATGVWRELGL